MPAPKPKSVLSRHELRTVAYVLAGLESAGDNHDVQLSGTLILTGQDKNYNYTIGLGHVGFREGNANQGEWTR